MTNDTLTANELDKIVHQYMTRYDVYPVMKHMEKVGYGQQMEVLNQTGNDNLYYQWLACLVRYMKPKQIVELGAAAGISTTMMALEMPQDCKLYSVDIDPEIAWKWMTYEHPNVTKILSDDLDMSIWKGVDLAQTDLWFIDSLHTEAQLRKELELYSPYFKKGAVVVFDDIRLPELNGIWNELTYDKCETTHPNHYSGFGHVIV